MGERPASTRIRNEEMASTSTAVATVSPQTQEEVERLAVITLRPSAQTKKESRKKVLWTEDTVDNENMNKKKSKCCCIYEKPRRFGESDSEESDDECEHCFGHVEKKHHHHHHHPQQQQPVTIAETSETETVPPEPKEPSASVILHDPAPAPAPPDEPAAS